MLFCSSWRVSTIVNWAVWAMNCVPSAGLMGFWYLSWATSSFRKASFPRPSVADLLVVVCWAAAAAAAAEFDVTAGVVMTPSRSVGTRLSFRDWRRMRRAGPERQGGWLGAKPAATH